MDKSFVERLGSLLFKEFSSVLSHDDMQESFQDALRSLPKGKLRKKLRSNPDKYLSQLEKHIAQLSGTKIPSVPTGHHDDSIEELSSLEERKDVSERSPQGHKQVKVAFNLLEKNPALPNKAALKDCTREQEKLVYSSYVRQTLTRSDVSYEQLTKAIGKLEHLLPKASEGEKTQGFSWQPLTDHLMQISSGVHPSAVPRLLRLLFQKVKDDVDNCLLKEKPVRSGKLAKILKTYLGALHMRVGHRDKKFVERTYCRYLSALLSCYVDLSCVHASKVEKRKRLGNQVCGFVSYLLQPWPEHVLEAVLQLSMVDSQYSDILLPLIGKCVSLKPERGQHSHYLKYVLVVRLAADQLGDLEQVLQWTLETKQLPASKGFLDWVQEQCPESSEHLPVEDRKFKKSSITKYLLEEADDNLICLLTDSLRKVVSTVTEEDILVPYSQEEQASQEQGTDDVAMETKDDGGLDMDSLFFLDTKGAGDKRKSTKEKEPVLLKTMEELGQLLDNNQNPNSAPQTYKLDSCLIDKFVDPEDKKFAEEEEIVSVSKIDLITPVSEETFDEEEEIVSMSKIDHTKPGSEETSEDLADSGKKSKKSEAVDGAKVPGKVDKEKLTPSRSGRGKMKELHVLESKKTKPTSVFVSETESDTSYTGNTGMKKGLKSEVHKVSPKAKVVKKNNEDADMDKSLTDVSEGASDHMTISSIDSDHYCGPVNSTVDNSGSDANYSIDVEQRPFSLLSEMSGDKTMSDIAAGDLADVIVIASETDDNVSDREINSTVERVSSMSDSKLSDMEQTLSTVEKNDSSDLNKSQDRTKGLSTTEDGLDSSSDKENTNLTVRENEVYKPTTDSLQFEMDLSKSSVKSGEHDIRSLSKSPGISSKSPISLAKSPGRSAKSPVNISKCSKTSAESPISSSKSPKTSDKSPISSAKSSVSSTKSSVSSTKSSVRSTKSSVSSATASPAQSSQKTTDSPASVFPATYARTTPRKSKTSDSSRAHIEDKEDTRDKDKESDVSESKNTSASSEGSEVFTETVTIDEEEEPVPAKTSPRKTSKSMKEKFIEKAVKSKTPKKNSVGQSVENGEKVVKEAGPSRTKSTEEIVSIVEEIEQKMTEASKKSSRRSKAADTSMFTDDSVVSNDTEKDEKLATKKSSSISSNTSLLDGSDLSGNEQNNKQKKSPARKSSKTSKSDTESSQDELFEDAKVKQSQEKEGKKGSDWSPRERSKSDSVSSDKDDKKDASSSIGKVEKRSSPLKKQKKAEPLIIESSDESNNEITFKFSNEKDEKSPHAKFINKESVIESSDESDGEIVLKDVNEEDKQDVKLSSPLAKSNKEKTPKKTPSKHHDSPSKNKNRKMSEEEIKSKKGTPQSLKKTKSPKADSSEKKKRSSIESSESEMESELGSNLTRSPKTESATKTRKRSSELGSSSPGEEADSPVPTKIKKPTLDEDTGQTNVEGLKADTHELRSTRRKSVSKLKTPVSTEKRKKLKSISDHSQKTPQKIASKADVVPSSHSKSPGKRKEGNVSSGDDKEQSNMDTALLDKVYMFESDNESATELPNLARHLKPTATQDEKLEMSSPTIPNKQKHAKTPKRKDKQEDEENDVEDKKASSEKKKPVNTRRSLRPRQLHDQSDMSDSSVAESKPAKSAAKPVRRVSLALSKPAGKQDAKVGEIVQIVRDVRSSSSKKATGGRKTTIKESDDEGDKNVKPSLRKLSASTSKKAVKQVELVKAGRKRRLSSEFSESEKGSMAGDSTDSEIAFPKVKKGAAAEPKVSARVSKRLSTPAAGLTAAAATAESAPGKRYSLRRK